MPGRPSELGEAPAQHGKTPSPAELARNIEMLRRSLHHQGRKDMELSRGLSDRQIEGDMLGDRPSLRVDSAVGVVKGCRHLVEAEPAKRRAHGNRRPVRWN